MKRIRSVCYRNLVLICAAGSILWLGFSASSCKRLDAGDSASARATPTPSISIPETEEPIIALVYYDYDEGIRPLFVLYRNGLVIRSDFKGPDLLMKRPESARLTPDQVRQIYSSLPLDSLAQSDKRKFKPGSGADADIYLFVRKPDGANIRIACYDVTFDSTWPSELRPPEAVTKTFQSLANYSLQGVAAQGVSSWTPPEIEVEFESQPPEPEDRAWWPKTWPLPNLKPDENHTQAEPFVRLPVSYDEQLRKYADSNVLLSGGSYEIHIRYPLPHEEGIVAELKKCCSDLAENLK